MQSRLEYAKASPAAIEAMRALETHVHRSGLEPALLELVRLRSSQINGWNRLAISFRTVPGTYQPAGR